LRSAFSNWASSISLAAAVLFGQRNLKRQRLVVEKHARTPFSVQLTLVEVGC